MQQPHIDEACLDEYVLGTLPEQRLAGVEEHLLLCPTCQSRLLDTDELVTLLRAAAPHLEARPVPWWRRVFPSPAVVWAGTASAAAALVIVLLGGEPQGFRPAPAVVMMQSLRGPEAGPQITAGKPSRLVFDLSLPSTPADYRVEIVDLAGNRIVEKEAEAQGDRIAALIGKLPHGSYWVRVYRSGGNSELIAEYALRSQ